jgi:hypothetical protein
VSSCAHPSRLHATFEPRWPPPPPARRHSCPPPADCPRPAAALTTAPAGEGSAVFVSNLQWWTTDAELEAACAPYGHVLNIRFIDDKACGKSRGMAIVEFAEAEAAAQCIAGLNGCVGWLGEGVGGRAGGCRVGRRRGRRARTVDGCAAGALARVAAVLRNSTSTAAAGEHAHCLIQHLCCITPQAGLERAGLPSQPPAAAQPAGGQHQRAVRRRRARHGQ